MNRPTLFWTGILVIAGAKLLIHLYANTIYGFHRDELLYLALGQHLAWGYWSNPPLIGALGWLAQHIGDGSVGDVRLLPTLAGCCLVVLAGAMAREMGGGRYAQVLAALAIVVSPAYLRSSVLFQPVIFDIVGWTVLSLLLLRYLNTERTRVAAWFGLTLGLVLLNKYMAVFWVAALVPALLLSRHWRLFWQRDGQIAMGLAVLVLLPNMYWQFVNHFPVRQHMQDLYDSQLVNTDAAGFLKSQLLMNFTATLVWIPGLWGLWKYREGIYRPVLYLFAGVILLLLLAKGKPYYSLGIYPIMMAAGAVYWEKQLRRWVYRVALPLVMVGLLVPLFPLAIPVFPPEKMADYCRWAAEHLGLRDVTRWENGEYYALPQDYADMLGWAELGQTAVDAYQQVPAGEAVLIYGENYGQAGAVDFYGRPYGLPPAVSFSDSYRLWLPDSTQAQTLIYINDELGQDVQELFADIRPIGSITNAFAREKGTTVYLCRQPRRSLDVFWRERLRQVRGQ
ncbi:MAG: glycosyltransferase family 39 protein [Saprospiraceae bacterium]|nr:glycosyltransferase family 39 protein [Saprospiraceae bacterium]